MGGLSVYRSLLSNRPLSWLLLGEFISGIGDWLYIVAVFVVIYEDSGDAALVGAFGAIRLLPYVFLSVPAGVVADRFERRLILLVSDLYRGGIMVLITILVVMHGPTASIAMLAIAAACGSAFFYPAIGAYIPSLVADERQLGPANSAWAALGNISFIAGPAIGGILIAVGGVTSAFVINALTFVVIAFILSRLPHSGRPGLVTAASALAPGELASLADGASVDAQAEPSPTSVSIRSRLRIRPLAGFTVVQLMGGFIGGGFQVITVILAIDILKAGQEANGYLNAAIGVGGLIGAAVAGALVLRRSLGLPLIIGAVVSGLGIVGLGLTTNLWLALLAIGIASAGALVIDVVGTTLFQRLVPNDLLGRGTGILMAVSTLTGAAGAFVMPVVLSSAGPYATFGVSGVAMIVVSVAGVLLVGSAATREPTPYEAIIARVSTLPLFAGVPGARLETAMHRLRQVPVTAGQAIVRQGEPADRFYIIERGSFTVTQAGPEGGSPLVLRQLGPDQVFGELGLLNASPRTATVTADEDGSLLALDGADFLALVGASGAFRGRLQGLYVGAGGSTR